MNLKNFNSIDNKDFKKLYWKYKKKYLKLKLEQNGGANTQIVSEKFTSEDIKKYPTLKLEDATNDIINYAVSILENATFTIKEPAKDGQKSKTKCAIRPYDLRVISRHSQDKEFIYILKDIQGVKIPYEFSISKDNLKKGMLKWFNSLGFDRYKSYYYDTIVYFDLREDSTYKNPVSGDFIGYPFFPLEVIIKKDSQIFENDTSLDDTIEKATVKESLSLLETLFNEILTTDLASATPEVKFPEKYKKEPVKAEPVKAEPVKAEPVKEEPVKAEPVKAEPVKEEPVKAEPVKEEPVKAEPVKEEPVKEEPVKEEKIRKKEKRI